MFLGLLLSQLALAAPIQLTCITDPPTTTFGIFTKGEKVEATVIFHYGAAYAPMINGMYTASDLPILAERAEMVKKLKDMMKFSWPKENCRQQDETLFKCIGASDVQLGRGGEKIQATALYTTRVESEGLAGKRATLKLNLSLMVDGKSGPYVEMEYDRSNCARGTAQIR